MEGYHYDASGTLVSDGPDSKPLNPTSVFDKEVLKGIQDAQNVIFELAHSPIGVLGDSFGTGQVDMDDLFSGSNKGAATIFLHFLAERFATPNYEVDKLKLGPLYQTLENSKNAVLNAQAAFNAAKAAEAANPTAANHQALLNAQTTGLNAVNQYQASKAAFDALFTVAHNQGIVVETQYVQEQFPSATINNRTEVRNPPPNTNVFDYGGKKMVLSLDPADPTKITNITFE